MFRRDILSWWLRPAFLRPWGRRRETLFAGPWVGEFGWELMHWQAFVRRLSRSYARTVVCCPEGHEALYADFAATIHPHRLRGIAETNALRDVSNPEERERIRNLVPAGCDHLKPLGHQPFFRQEFVRFGTRRPELRVDVLFHPRGRAFEADRNWSPDRWRELLAMLRGQGLTLGCLGLRAATVPLEGDFRDLRDLPLSETLDVIASARAVIGLSSGPMHLASLCGTPHLVWADRRRYARGHSSREKYESLWNPLGTSVRVIDADGFDPAPEKVAAEVEALLGNGTGP